MQQRKTVQTVDSYARRGEALPDFAPQPAQLARRTTFVPAAPQPAHVPDFAPVQGLDVQSPATSNVELRTTYVDRAKGFLWETTPLAVTTSVLSCVAGVGLFSVPLLSWSLLQVFMVTFCATWAVAYAVHKLASPDGTLLFSAWQLWRTVQREQKHRHQRYWTAREDARRDGRL